MQKLHIRVGLKQISVNEAESQLDDIDEYMKSHLVFLYFTYELDSHYLSTLPTIRKPSKFSVQCLEEQAKPSGS